MFNNNFNCNNNDFDNNCCPKVVFALIPETTPPVGPEEIVTPTLTIGTVTTGDPGTPANASITGTAPNFVLNLTIPQGLPGAAIQNEKI